MSLRARIEDLPLPMFFLPKVREERSFPHFMAYTEVGTVRWSDVNIGWDLGDDDHVSVIEVIHNAPSEDTLCAHCGRDMTSAADYGCNACGGWLITPWSRK